MKRFVESKLANHAEKLRSFYAVAEEGSFRGAARALNMTQPPVSTAVAQLEDLLGSSLFDRTPRGIRLTRSGEKLLGFTKRYFREFLLIESELENLQQAPLNLKLGTYDSIARYLWPKIFKNVGSTLPQVSISLTTGRSSTIVEQVRKQELDAAIVVEAQGIEDLTCEELYSDYYGLFVAHDVEDPSGSIISVSNALTAKGRTVREELDRKNLIAKTELNLDSFEACLEFTLQGLGLGVLPFRVVESFRAREKLIDVTEKHMGVKRFGLHRFHLVYQKELEDLELSRQFLDLLRKLAN